MSLFNFGRKSESSKEYSLTDIAVFSSLTVAEQKMIEKKGRIVEYKRGDIVYQEGTPSDAFYVVISGRFRLFLKAKSGLPEKTVIYFYRGDHFGEASLLTGRPHSATVEAKRDGLILKIEKDEFLQLVKDIPAISQQLNRSMGIRLGKIENASRQEVRIAALYGGGDNRPLFRFWSDLAVKLSQETKRKVIVLDFIQQPAGWLASELQASAVPHFDLSKNDPTNETDLKTVSHKHPNGFTYLRVVHPQQSAADEKRLFALMTFLTYRYDYLLLRMPLNTGEFSFKIIKQADVIYLHAGSKVSELQDTADAVREFTERFAFNRNELRIMVADDEEKHEAIEKKEEVIGARVFALIPSREKQEERYQASMRYIAKEFSGRLLGLALGSGAAYGLAHIGVLKVLEREGIYPDIIAGSSIGALVGGFWGAGFNSAEIEAIAKDVNLKTGFFKLIGFADMSLPHNGFFKGNQVTRWMDGFLRNKTFQDLRIPVKIVAANLFTSESVVMDTGKVSDAIRASISIPGIFRPLSWQGKKLIDGGVIDPLPVSLLHSLGVKKVISVNVLPGPKDRIEKNRIGEEDAVRKLREATSKGSLQKAWVSSLQKVQDRYSVNIFNVIMNTIQFLEYEIAKSSGTQADVNLHPIVRDAHWAEFYSPEKFIKVGEEKAQEHLEEIKKLISE